VKKKKNTYLTRKQPSAVTKNNMEIDVLRDTVSTLCNWFHPSGPYDPGNNKSPLSPIVPR